MRLRGRPVGALVLVFLSVAGCAASSDARRATTVAPGVAVGAGDPTDLRGTAKQDDPPRRGGIARRTPGERVLRAADRMIRRRTIRRGSCWDYVDGVFTRAGYPHGHRAQAFRGPTGGPYADLASIEPGDWLAFVTHPERDPIGTHSVIFVEWEDRATGRARVVSYAGDGAARPGGYVTYDVTRTYRITRATGSPSW